VLKFVPGWVVDLKCVGPIDSHHGDVGLVCEIDLFKRSAVTSVAWKPFSVPLGIVDDVNFAQGWACP